MKAAARTTRASSRAQAAPPPPLASYSYTRAIVPRTEGQRALVDAIGDCEMVLALGPAGSGKTFLAVAKAVEALQSGRVDRIVLSRPAVEAGETLGFLPGELEEKLAPYLRPLYDALGERLSLKATRTMVSDGAIEIAPIGFMRGRTIGQAFVVVDEAQNCTYAQLKMVLTRLGSGSTMVITGDPGQSDLASGLSGLAAVAERLDGVDGVAVVRLGDRDIVRHPLVARVLSVL